MTDLLELVDVGVRRGMVDVVRGVDLTLAAGEIVAVLGPNGAGKSTLLEMIGGVLPASSGTIRRNGRVATALQSPDLAARTAQGNIELALGWWGVARTARHGRAAEALTAMGVAHLATRPARALSGGEARRVHLARAIALRPDILLLDEPFAGLDPVSRASLLDDTGTALRSHAGGVIVVVHDRAEAWAIADRLVILIEGRIAAAGRPRELLDKPPSAEVARFLGFIGEQRDHDDLLMLRPSHVQLDPAGSGSATVTRLVPQEDGARVELENAYGRFFVTVPYPGPTVGDDVRLRITGGVRFPGTGG